MCPTTQEILHRVAAAFGLTVQKILSRDRKSRESDARKVAAYLLRTHAGYCLREISTTLNRGAGCCNMIGGWIQDAKNYPFLKNQAQRIHAEMIAAAQATSLTHGPVHTTSTPDTSRRVLVLGEAHYFIASFIDSQWWDMRTGKLLETQVQAWQDLTQSR